MFLLDYIIKNTDRHIRNFGVIRYERGFKLAPLFDNGCALDTNRRGNINSCTISGSFEQQLIATGFPIKYAFNIDKELLEHKISNERNGYELQNLIKGIKLVI